MKRFFIGTALFALFVLFAVRMVRAGTLSCYVSSTCPSGVVVLHLASTTNSHSELPSGSSYTNFVCCTGVGSLGTSCTTTAGPTTTFLHLAYPTNSHVEENTQNNYPTSNYACLSVASGGSLSVGYQNGNCNGFDTALVSIASTTNSHAAMPGSSTFQPGTTIQVCATASDPPPSVTNIVLNGGNPSMTLNVNATTSFNITYKIVDYTGCSDAAAGMATSTAFRGGVAGTCAVGNPATNNLNCYLGVRSTSTCSGNITNVTDTVSLYYFANSTGNPSSSYPSDHWYANVNFISGSGATSSATSSPVDVAVLTGVSVTPSSIGYGTVNPNSNTGSVNQSTIISNGGNSSTTLQLSGTSLFLDSNDIIPTSSQHYATTPFTFGGSEAALSGTPTNVSGFLLTSPTSTNPVSSPMYWGVQVPNLEATGTYTGTNIFTAIFSS